jgi:hypothetical protein
LVRFPSIETLRIAKPLGNIGSAKGKGGAVCEVLQAVAEVIADPSGSLVASLRVFGKQPMDKLGHAGGETRTEHLEIRGGQRQVCVEQRQGVVGDKRGTSSQHGEEHGAEGVQIAASVGTSGEPSCLLWCNVGEGVLESARSHHGEPSQRAGGKAEAKETYPNPLDQDVSRLQVQVQDPLCMQLQ